MYTIITNNSMVRDRYQDQSKKVEIDCLDSGTLLDVLQRVRDQIHKGKRLESHPMAGSIKPNQNPYKTVIISDSRIDEDEFKEFVMIIENGILTARKFLDAKALPQWPEHILQDFRTVDFTLIQSVMERLL